MLKLGASNPWMIVLLYVLTIVMLLITLTIHELGHYTFARIFKVNVKEFSIGIGPRLFSKNNKRGTRISLRLIPLMAYVMMDSVQLREVYASEKKDKNYKFMMQKKPKGTFLLEEVKTWKYMFIMFGGVLFNLVFFGLLCGIVLPLVHLETGNFFNPFVSLALSFEAIGRDMIFIGNGDIFGQIGTIANGNLWWLSMLLSLLMMNLITFIFNLIPFPPLDGWKVVGKTYRQFHHKPINEKLENALTIIGLILMLWIFISGIVCDIIN